VTERHVVPTLVSLFTGAGGMDIGLERAGWRTVVAADIDADCVASLDASRSAAIPIGTLSESHHLAEARIFKTDIRDLTGADLRPPGVPLDWRPSLLAGGPPCQPWSSAGLQRGLLDVRGRLIDHMIRLTRELRPRLVLFENVRGLVTALGPTGHPGEALQLIKRAFEDLGYATTFAMLNAANYGAAQRRVRLFMMASDQPPLPRFPEPTHDRAAHEGLGGSHKPWVTLGEFLNNLSKLDPADVVRPTERQQVNLARLVPGTGVRTKGRVENNRPGGHWGYRQDSFLADLSLPARTIRAASTPDWIRLPDGTHRRLTWRECAVIQGFPVDWRFVGTVASKFRQIGNAVQADVAEAVGRALFAALHTASSEEELTSAPLPPELVRRVKYTAAEHRTNGEHRIRVRALVT
jgi:DNA (cytosine-5)-methyltransferase 1